MENVTGSVLAKPLTVALATPLSAFSLEMSWYFFSPFEVVYSILVYIKLSLVGLVHVRYTSPGPASVFTFVTFSGAALLTEILPSTSSPQELNMADKENKITVEKRAFLNGNFRKSFFINYKFKINTIVYYLIRYIA